VGWGWDRTGPGGGGWGRDGNGQGPHAAGAGADPGAPSRAPGPFLPVPLLLLGAARSGSSSFPPFIFFFIRLFFLFFLLPVCGSFLHSSFLPPLFLCPQEPQHCRRPLRLQRPQLPPPACCLFVLEHTQFRQAAS